jgi:cell division protein FtsB
MKFSTGKIAIGAVALATVCYGLAELEKRAEVRRLKKENKDIEDEVARLQKRVDKLQTDPAAQELEIRKRLGLVKDGETVYMLQDKDLKATPTPGR